MERNTEENLKLAKDQLKLSLETTQEFMNMWTKNYQSTLGKLAQMPAFGPVREKQEKFMKSLPIYPKLYTAWIDSNINLQSVLLEATRRTFETTMKHRLDSKSCAKDDKSYIDPEKYKEFYKVWIDTYSDTFKEFMKSEHYASDMGKFASVFIDFQKHNREIIEENYLKPNNLPTMTHVDDIHNELYDLRKTVKGLVGDMEELRDLRKTVKKLVGDMEELSKEIPSGTVGINDVPPKESDVPKESEPLKKMEPPRSAYPHKKAESPKKVEQPEKAEPHKEAEPLKKVEQPEKAEPHKEAEPLKKMEPPKSAYPHKKAEPPKKVEQPEKAEPHKEAEPLKKVEQPKSQEVYPHKEAESPKKVELHKKAEPAKIAEPSKKVELPKKAEPAKIAEPSKKVEPSKSQEAYPQKKEVHNQ